MGADFNGFDFSSLSGKILSSAASGLELSTMRMKLRYKTMKKKEEQNIMPFMFFVVY
jgi:hypothetical protein